MIGGCFASPCTIYVNPTAIAVVDLYRVNITVSDKLKRKKMFQILKWKMASYMADHF